jgi:hypothetical protein
MTVPSNADYVTGQESRSICAELGRCAYDVANDQPDSGCPYWRDCFGDVSPNDGSRA